MGVYVSRPLLIALVVAAFAIGAAIAGAAFTARVPDTEEAMRLANSYAPDLHTGRKLAVRWSGAVLDKDNAKTMDEYKWSGEWFDAVYKRMASDFGPAIAETWAIGKGYTTLGESARVEHEARVIGLARLMDDMRNGRLPKVKP